MGVTIFRPGIRNVQAARGVRVYEPTMQAVAWDPSQPLPDSGLLPHTWHYVYPGLVSPVASMTNQGTDVHTITQAVLANRPTIAVAALNGKDILTFDGGDWLRGTFTGAVTQPHTALAAAQLNPALVNNDNFYFICDGSASTNRTIMGQNGTPAPDAWGIYAGIWLSGGASDGNWNIWTALFNGGASQFWTNGISEAVGNAGAHDMTGITLGANVTNIACWNGYIAELLIYSANLSDADKNTVGNYLATRYALPYVDI